MIFSVLRELADIEPAELKSSTKLWAKAFGEIIKLKNKDNRINMFIVYQTKEKIISKLNKEILTELNDWYSLLVKNIRSTNV